ncbi:MAG: 1-phosphofructokinase family hexose kinase [Mycoplasmataceae bacterium]|nr:1-phosphofructokinase family hexose kinase [Mycoplasmataceae bacterium]
MNLNFKSIKNKKVLTVTLNPAIDKQWSVKSLEIGEVNRINQVSNSAGGKGLNEARALHQLGINVVVTGIIAGENGSYLMRALDKEKIKHQFYKLQYGQTRICVNANNVVNHQITELLEPGPTVNKTDANKFLIFFQKLIKGFDIVSLAGSLPHGLEPMFYGKLIKICHKQKIEVFLDTSGASLIDNLINKPNFVKPNVDEIRQLLKRKNFSKKQAIDFAKEQVKNGISNFVISLGEDGALLITKQGIYHAIPPKHLIVNTVGCGDTLVAGFLACELLEASSEQKITFATGLATNASTTKGTAEINLKTLNDHFPKVIITSN